MGFSRLSIEWDSMGFDGIEWLKPTAFAASGIPATPCSWLAGQRLVTRASILEAVDCVAMGHQAILSGDVPTIARTTRTHAVNWKRPENIFATNRVKLFGPWLVFQTTSLHLKFISNAVDMHQTPWFLLENQNSIFTVRGRRTSAVGRWGGSQSGGEVGIARNGSEHIGTKYIIREL